MNSNQGFTIEPQLYIDPISGEERLSYEGANITDHAVRRAEYDSVQDHQSDYITEDSQGNRTHYFDIENGEDFDNGQYQIEDDFESEDDEEFTWEDAVMEAVDENYGENYYDELIEWCEECLDDESCDEFNETDLVYQLSIAT